MNAINYNLTLKTISYLFVLVFISGSLVLLFTFTKIQKRGSDFTKTPVYSTHHIFYINLCLCFSKKLNHILIV